MPPSFLLSLLVLVAGAAVSVAWRSNRGSATAAIVSQSVACVLVLTSVVPALHGRVLHLSVDWPPPIQRVVFEVDALGAFFLVWSLPLTLLGTIYAVGYLRPYFERGRRGGSHFALLNVLSVSFVLIYSVQNPLVFLLGWELAAVAAWLLVIWDYESQRIRFAGFNYLVSTHVGLFVLVAAFMLLHSNTGVMDFASFAGFLRKPSQLRGTIFLLLGVAFGLKSAFFPFHTWLPRAHAAAPAHVSALMSGVIHKAGLFAFLRFTLLIGRPEEWMGWSVLAFGALSAFFGVLYTSTQRDLKRLLGYSSTENVGIAAMSFGVGYLGWTWGVPTLVACGFAGGLLHLLNHAVFKCLLFYAAGSVYRATGTVDLERLGGLAKRLPLTASLFLLGGLAISALPPFNGFVSELVIYSGLLSGGAPTRQGNMVFVVAAAGLAFVGAVSALSTCRAFGIGFLGSPRDSTVVMKGEADATMQLPMLLHAFGIVVLGTAPAAGLWLVAPAVALFPTHGAARSVLEPLSPAIVASRVLAMVLLVAGALAWQRRRKARLSVTWGCGYTASSSRMQYTASSVSEQFARLFDAFMPALRRERLPREIFPREPGRLATHHPDAVERRMFEVLDQGEDMVVQASARIPEQPRFAFAAGLLALLVIGILIFGASR